LVHDGIDADVCCPAVHLTVFIKENCQLAQHTTNGC
jgi:hypothetical protein